MNENKIRQRDKKKSRGSSSRMYPEEINIHGWKKGLSVGSMLRKEGLLLHDFDLCALRSLIETFVRFLLFISISVILIIA